MDQFFVAHNRYLDALDQASFIRLEGTTWQGSFKRLEGFYKALKPLSHTGKLRVPVSVRIVKVNQRLRNLNP